MGNRENETALWLHNKLGSTDDLWSGRSICSQITKERLQDIVGCFRSLQAHVKVKLLLSFLHIVRRNVAESEWKTLLDEIIDLACDDRDQWVATTGEILKTYPSTFLVNTTDLSGSSTFHAMYTELKKAVRKSGESHTLPIECVCLGKNALSAAIPQLPHTSKHFILKRKTKSSALRGDLLTKSQEIQSSTKKGIPISTIPMKVLRTAKRMDEEMAASTNSAAARNGGSNTGFLKANTLSSFTSAQRNSSSLAMRKEGGAKMLDISEMPPTGKEAKRRKKLEEQEAAAQVKKEKEEAAAAEKAAVAAQATPDYAAGLGSTTRAPIKSAMPRAPKPKAPTTVPSYMPDVTPRLPNAGYVRDLPLSSPTIQPAVIKPVPPSPTTTNFRVRAPLPSNFQPKPVTPTQTLPSPGAAQPIIQQSSSQTVAAAATANQQPGKKPLSLTKEQMIEAQEMFKNSNKVTRPEKALILGFMAGSRDNPCPQQGHIVNIRLSEKIEPVRLQDNSVREMMSETFFQMNYQTGEWRRIKKFKEPPRIS